MSAVVGVVLALGIGLGQAPGAGHVESVGPASETGREPALEDWSLTVISEEPGGPREIPLPGQGPADWRDIDELRTVSGTGIYRVRVTRGSDPAALAGAFAVNDVSINSVRQNEYVGVEQAIVTIVTHPAAVFHLDAAVEALRGEERVLDVVSVRRVGGG